MSRGNICAMNLATIIVFILARSVGAANEDGSSAHKDEDRKWGQAVNGQALSIATAKSEYASGDPVVLNIIFKNVGNEEVRSATQAFFANFRIVVLFTEDQSRWAHSVPGHHEVFDLLPKGNEVPPTLYGKYEMERSFRGSRSFPVLKPGTSQVFDVDLNRLFDMTLKRGHGFCGRIRRI